MSVSLQTFKQQLSDEGLESVVNRFYGTYEGTVDSNKDPDFSGRLRLKCPIAWGEDVHEYWAPSRGMPSGEGLGLWMLPNKGDKVWVTFQAGDPRFPIWEYGPFTKAGVPSKAKSGNPDPTKVVVLQSTAGYRLVLDEIRKEIRLEMDNGQVQPIILGNDWVDLMKDFVDAIGNLTGIPVPGSATGPINTAPTFVAFQQTWNLRFKTVLSKFVKTV